VEVKEEKKHPADFALWKKCVGSNENHVLRWNSPWGEGFPGWHIECSAMSTKFLGEEIDVHTGGEDNIFPHHECEIAQSESVINDINVSKKGDSTGSRGSRSANGTIGAEKQKKPSEYRHFVRFWLHKRRIDIASTSSAQGECVKMSKSLGNVLSIDDIRNQGYSPLDLRYYFLSVHYRTQLKYTEKGLEDAHKARRKILEWMSEMDGVSSSDSGDDQSDHVRGAMGEFTDAMNADLNTPAALAVVFDFMTWTRTQESMDQKTLETVGTFITMIRQTFGCFDVEKTQSIPSEVQKLLDERKAARDSKDFETSDRLRDQITELGYEVRDEGGEQVVKKL